MWMDFAISKKLIYHSCTPEEYPGFDLKHIPYFEDLFKINVNIYELNISNSVTTVFKSMSKHSETLYLNHFNSHLFPIMNINAYLEKARFQCRNCNKLFDRMFGYVIMRDFMSILVILLLSKVSLLIHDGSIVGIFSSSNPRQNASLLFSANSHVHCPHFVLYIG